MAADNVYMAKLAEQAERYDVRPASPTPRRPPLSFFAAFAPRVGPRRIIH